jgi:hypothetical protein
MKITLLIISILSANVPAVPKSSAAPLPVDIHHEVQFRLFISSLVPYREWIEDESSIRVWRPSHKPNHRRPYILGRWIYTDHGWYRVSNERRLSMEMQQEKLSRERSTQIQEHQSQRDRREMRRELIQRYDRMQRISPPVLRENQHDRSRQRKENSGRPHTQMQEKE